MRMGGAERITVALLPHIDRQRITPIVGVLSTEGESPLGEQLGEVQRLDLEAKRLLDPAALRRLLRFIEAEQIDLIHAQLQYATIFAAIAKQVRGVPMVVTRHLIADDEANWREAFRNKIERWTVKRYAAKMITVSDAAQHYYANLTEMPPQQFQTIYNGIDLSRFAASADKATLRASLGLPTDATIVCMVGVMRQGKGHTVLIEAAKQLPDAYFILVGDGELRPELEAQASDLIAQNRLLFMGQRLDIPDILNASDIFVLPSDSEALPTVLIEAGAARLPVVATRVGGIPEIIQDGQTGIIIPPKNPATLADVLRGLISDSAKRESMGAGAYAHIQAHFTLEQQAAATMALYESVVKQ